MEEHQMSIEFTEGQKKHALETIEAFVKQRRFFLDFSDLPIIDYSKIFYNIMYDQKKLFDFYKETRGNAENLILDTEKELGFYPAVIPKDKTIVQCNNYGGGFDTKLVIPLSYFLDITISYETVYNFLYGLEVKPENIDDISPKQMGIIKSGADNITKKILVQWDELSNNENFQNLCFFVFKSRFWLSGGHGKNDDFTEGKFDNIKFYPELLGYLFYLKPELHVLCGSSYLVFGTSRKSHVRFSTGSKSAYINFVENGGYDCCSFVATVM